jgi:hypothetical protein
MAIIDSRGIVDDGTSGLSVAGQVTSQAQVLSVKQLTASGSVQITSPGFYFLAATGSESTWGGYFTGSVPDAGSFPGSELVIAETANNFAWQLTGSSHKAGRAVFVHKSGSLPGAPHAIYGGTAATLSPSGSVILRSDGFRWCILGGSGSCTLSGLNK